MRNSQVLQSYPLLHNIFQQYFISKPKEFIELIRNNPHATMEQLINLLQNVVSTGLPHLPQTYHDVMEVKTRSQVNQINQLYNLKGDKNCVH